MKERLRVFGIAIWKRALSFFSTLEKFVVSIPERIKRQIFAFARWGKMRLDGMINLTQREQLYTIIFKSETPQGRRFDRWITWAIIFSVLVVILETVSDFHRAFWWIFFLLEWLFTIVFTVEYVLRLYCARNPIRYATSFFGIVDLLAIIPAYLGFIFIGAQNLLIIRALKLLRVFRIFKMGHFVTEGEVIVNALNASKTKIYVFISFIVLLSMILGSVLYIVEGGVNPNLDNIPKGIYWAIVTLTTVGYGDVVPITTFGKFVSTVVMLMGYGVIAIPTGIVTAEISGRVMNLKEVITKVCEPCGQSEHHTGAKFCHKCGEKL